jgi:hypothetical protein
VQWLIGDLVAGERSPFQTIQIYTETNL